MPRVGRWPANVMLCCAVHFQIDKFKRRVLPTSQMVTASRYCVKMAGARPQLGPLPLHLSNGGGFDGSAAISDFFFYQLLIRVFILKNGNLFKTHTSDAS